MSDGLDFIYKIYDDFGKWKFVLEDGLTATDLLITEGASS